MSSVAATSKDRSAALDALHNDIERKHLFPFWAVNAGPGHDEVQRLMGAAPRAVPFLWSYAEVLEPLLVKAAKLVTTVEGEDMVFGPGDLVLTPHDTWHNHGNVGDEPAVNLSVLDLPLVETLNAIDFEHEYREVVDGQLVKKKVQWARVPSDYSQRIYGRGGLSPRFVGHDRGTGAASPMYVYRWEPMREMLEQHKDWDGDP